MPRVYVLTILSLFVVAVPSRAQVTVGVKVDKDVPYSKIGADKDLRMDIAYPIGKGPFPTLALIHGGAWRMGKRQDLSEWMAYLASEGYVAATISYRLLPDMKFPDPVVDGKTAVRFLRANAAKYGVNKDKVGALGFSAGAYLASMLGVASPKAGFEGKEFADQSSQVQAVVSYFGPTDLSFYGNDESAQNAIFVPMLGGRFKDKPGAYKDASPITYVSKDSPPFLLLHGTKDWIVPIEHARAMSKKLKEAGATAELIEIAGAGHGFEKAEARQADQAMLRFLEKNLKK
jgi:acetyl esterase/lipase